MRLRDRLALLVFLISLISYPVQSFLLPIFFPLSVKITFHTNSKPKPPPAFHFEAAPVYREVVVKGSAHISPPVPKYSYGDGTKYGTSFGDGRTKVYTEEPHIIRGHKYATGYGLGGSIEGQLTVSAGPVAPPTHYKGTPYDGNSGTHYKDVPYPGTHYGGSTDGTHYKGTAYEEIPQTHYKGTAYEETPQTHYKGTAYEETPQTHYKGTAYEEIPQTHYKGTAYEEIPGHYPGTSKSTKIPYKPHSYIKSVGTYKLSDYVTADKISNHQDKDDAYTDVPLGKTYAEIASAHKASYGPKAYDAKQYTDIGVPKYNKGYEHDTSYIDDTMPIYKANIPRPEFRYRQGSASRFDDLVREPTETKIYAGFGTSIYGDSYAKIVYVPRNLRISIRAYAHK